MHASCKDSVPVAEETKVGAPSSQQRACLDADGQPTPLHKTLFDKVRHGEVNEVNRMITEMQIDVKNVVDELKNFSQTLLFQACVIRDPSQAFRMVQMLSAHGVDAKKEDTLKQTPLFYAARQGNQDIVTFLCKEGGDQVNRQDKYGQTPIYYAVREGHIKIVQLLIEFGAEFDITDSKD